MIYNDEKEISLIDLCLYVLKKWKLIVIVAVVLAIIVAGFTYIHSSNAYKVAMNASTEASADIKFTEEEEEALHLKLEAIAAYADNISDYEYYLEHSIRVNMNANKFYKGTLEYIFTNIENEELLKASTLIESQVFSEENYEEIAGALEYQTDATLLKEVVTAEYKDVVKYVITVRHFDEIDCETMLSFYEEQLESLDINWEKASATVRTASDRSLMNVRNEVIKAKTDAYNAMTTLVNNMSEKEKAYYTQMQVGNTEVKKEVLAVPTPSVNLKMSILAALAGIFCVAAFCACIYLFDGRVHSKKEMESWFNLPVIEAGKDDDMTAILLSGIARQNVAKKVYLTGKGLESNQSMNQKLKSLLEKEGVAVVFGGDILNDSKALHEVTECDSIVLMEQCYVSKENEIKEKIKKISACGATVIGVVLQK